MWFLTIKGKKEMALKRPPPRTNVYFLALKEGKR